MLRILIIEDVRDVLEGLRDLLCRIYQDWEVDTAAAVDEAEEKIRAAAASEEPYAAVIVDYELPPTRGAQPENSLSFVNFVTVMLPETLILQITAYKRSDSIAKHIDNLLAEPNPRCVFIEKDLKVNWPRHVAEITVQRVLGDPIEELLDMVYGPEPVAAGAGRLRRTAVPRGASLTQNIAMLQYKIAKAWKYLSPKTQERIKKNLVVDAKVDPVKVTIF